MSMPMLDILYFQSTHNMDKIIQGTGTVVVVIVR